ncbi:hypothetical protein PFLUV_G00166940 [Perca fluviatilis]|uniref:Chemokine interleukin-8-like domain-containing protein n=1 Tax=Perca fluviatilis TaxID=8168 RepID=A0A6A5ENV2_PERFL|nr:C-X-C motif chemokine 2-like [Perca fluviatilis]KAF1380728.1 hypothetical protein PFLUV_G00166940 [Perca fluviatilis]
MGLTVSAREDSSNLSRGLQKRKALLQFVRYKESASFKTRMNTSIQCIIVLACCITYTSMAILQCQCIKSSRSVDPSLIADVKEYPPRPYCNKKEVIAVLKDKTLRCLDPSSRFTQAVLQTIKMQMVVRAAKKNITSPKTTTASATVSATVSATATPASS